MAETNLETRKTRGVPIQAGMTANFQKIVFLLLRYFQAKLNTPQLEKQEGCRFGQTLSPKEVDELFS